MGITEIGEYAFYKCSALKDVAIPMVEEVKNYAFLRLREPEESRYPEGEDAGRALLAILQKTLLVEMP